MQNIYEYIKYYKKSTFDEINFNVMDALIYSILSYLPLENIEDGSNFNMMLKKLKDIEFEKDSLNFNAKEILKITYQSKRYENVRIFNVSKKENEYLQFGAMTFRDKDYTFVAFQGTNGTLIGWKENFNLSYSYLTATQKEAIRYLDETINDYDKNVYIGGHSKGGNLAMTVGMECKKNQFNKIKKIFNFDGPGFRKEQFESEKFEIMSKKLCNILPDGSLVGILLNNKNYNYIKSKGKGVEKHNPFNWYVFGQFFVENKIHESSKNLHENINKSVELLNVNDMQTVIDTLYSFLVKNNIKYIKDIKYINVSEFKNMIEQLRGTDENTRKLFFDVAKVLISPE